MLPKENRLKKERDFENVFKFGKSCSEGLLRTKIASNNIETSRFGFVVSKKYSKKASERNLIKRRLRESVRKFLPEVKKGFDVVFFVVPGLENNFETLLEKAEQILKKAKLL